MATTATHERLVGGAVAENHDLQAALREYHIPNLALRRLRHQLEGKEMARATDGPPRRLPPAPAHMSTTVWPGWASVRIATSCDPSS